MNEYSVSGLMPVEKVASSLHVDFIGMPSKLCTQKGLVTVQHNFVRISGNRAKGKEKCAPSLEPQSKCTQEVKLKKMGTMKLHIGVTTELENNVA